MANTYAITGATGNIGHQITKKLMAEGHKVRAIARTAEKLQSITDKGAEARSGSVEDTAFLTEAYRGVDGVFAMVPPDFQSDDYRAFQIKAAKSHVAAIKGSGVKNVVALSSIGAHLTEGAGIVQGLHDFEQHLSELNDVNVLVLRPAYFMENIYLQMDVIKNMGICGSPIAPDVSQPMVATKDIAAVAAGRLARLEIKGHAIEYISGQRNLNYTEVTQALAKALDKDDLKYVQFPYEDARQAMVQMGLTKNLADLLIGLAKAINSGDILSHYQRTPENTTETSIEEFAQGFAAAYKAQQ
jgi:uncharacterized protein YbjT (DUF2867 family)